jgi:hypothetical protein
MCDSAYGIAFPMPDFELKKDAYKQLVIIL